jgi:uncharacterized lipoprotein YmbA
MTIRRTGVLALTVLVAGCSLFSRPKNTFYSLETLPPASPAAAAAPLAAAVASPGTPIGIDALELPPGLDRRGIVIRGADHTVEVRGTNQWTSDLQEMVLHTLAFDLANRLPEGMVVLPGQPKPNAMRPVSVVLDDLAPGPDKVFVLDARWTMSDVTHHERITIPLQTLDSPAIVTAMSQALATLADRLAAGAR